VFTVSPVKHLRDGVIENNLSKAILIQSVHRLVQQNERCLYFPAYELVADDLRDYRFYEADMAHPNLQAINYVWSKFSEVYFNEITQPQWEILSKNPNAIHILGKYLNNLPHSHWEILSKNPGAIPLLEQNLDKVDWYKLCSNPNGIPLLEKHFNKHLNELDWYTLSKRPKAIHLMVKLNKKQMFLNCKSFAEELTKYVFHPSRLSRITQCYNIDLDEYFDLM
jgi:hypothetical protein